MENRKFKKFISLLLAAVLLVAPFSNTAMAASTQVGDLGSRSSPILGTFYLKNPETSKYIDIDDGAGYHYEGAILEQFDFDGDNSQKWQIVFNNNVGGYSYYTIKNVKSDLYMAVENNSSGDANIILSELNSYHIEDGQLWRIEATANNRYKIIPKCGETQNKVLCVNTTLFGINTNGVNIMSKTYADNSSYKDEWYLERTADVVFPQIKLVSYYDQAYDDFFPEITSSSLLEPWEIAIPGGAMVCAATVMEAILPIRISGGGISKVISSADAHTGTCYSLCSTNCYEHHKNIVRLSNDIYYGSRDVNTIYISWTQRTNDLCEVKDNTHTMLSNDVLGGVYNHRPVVGIYNCDYAPSIGVCSSLTLLHELGHSLGLDEKYNKSGDDHSSKSKFFCVMQKYDSTKAQKFYDDIYIDGKEAAFCDDCIYELSVLLQNYQSN